MATLARSVAPRIAARGGWRAATVAPVLIDVLAPFLASRALFAVITITASWWIAAFHLPQAAPAIHDGIFGRYWYRWDAVWYMRVATDGYRTVPYAHGHLNLAFFPLYPLLLHGWMAVWPWSRAIGAMLVANLCHIAASYYLYRLVAIDHGRDWARRVVWLLAFFPTGLFLSAGYSEAVFLLCLVRTFHALRLQRWWRAGLWGALATLTRPLGIIVIAPFLVSWYQEVGAAWTIPWARATWRAQGGSRARNALRRIRHQMATLIAVALIPVGLLIYMAYLWARFGDPLAFNGSQRSWHRAWTWPWHALEAAITRPLAHFPQLTPDQVHALLDTAWAIVFLAITLRAARTMPRVYRVFVWLFWAVTLSTPAILDGVPDPLISLPRFLLMAFPLLIFLAATPRRARIAAALSIPLLIVNTAIFVSGGWVA